MYGNYHDQFVLLLSTLLPSSLRMAQFSQNKHFAMIHRLSLIVSFFLLTCSLAAQQEDHIDHIYLQGGNFLQGTIVDTVNQDYLQLKLGGDSLLLIPLSLVEKVKPGKKKVWRNPKGRSVQSDGFYFEIATQLLSAKSYFSWSDEVRTNVGLQFNGGYYVRPWLSVGAGMGVDRYEQLIVPVFGQVRAYWPGWGTAPYLSLQAGHGIAVEKLFDRPEFDVSRGGYFWYPSIGIRLASRRQADFHFDLGYKFQRVTEEFDYPDEWWTTNVKERLTYRSFAIRLGCTF